ncbi:MAG: alpha-amylase [Chlorobiaceae bacterium]|nr:alpha-amylase [Chlorobiaceae bacterium]NMW22197.1 alpha-amylase [Chlorobiaceae bacterium]
MHLSAGTYRVPGIWTGKNNGIELVNPAEYFKIILENILECSVPHSPRQNNADWRESAVVYNLFIRLTTAFDHNGDGTIASEPLACGFRETGTFLKAIALLPYIKNLGANTVYILPVTEIGSQNRKGSLGSPYAVKDPRKLDPMLDEPALGFSPEFLLKAFAEAAHILDIHVVLEFVFRTSSMDSNWIQEHPEWFYWIRDHENTCNFGPPHFDPDTLTWIHEMVDRHEMHNLPAPSSEYREQFVTQPVTVHEKDGIYKGTAKDGTLCRIASAFSDWPPDDKQPAWSDVTYLKMHNHDAFNYIAYNTIRMYDCALENPEYNNTSLWNEILDIIPSYQKLYDIDGAMIDMGHALPSELKKSIVRIARENKPGFAFWDENFNPTPEIRDEGFNAVFGSLPFVIHDIVFIRGLLNYLNKTGVALPFFGTGENHNTPRVCFRYPREEAGRNFSIFIFTLSAILPAIPFLQSGMELCEWHPVNLGLNFNDEDRALYPPEKLPLFSACSYDWENCNGLLPLNTYIRRILDIRKQYLDLVLCGETGSMTIPYVSEPELFAVMRTSDGSSLLFIGNSNLYHTRTGALEFSMNNISLYDLIGETSWPIREHKLTVTCNPGQCMLFELPPEV